MNSEKKEDNPEKKSLGEAWEKQKARVYKWREKNLDYYRETQREYQRNFRRRRAQQKKEVLEKLIKEVKEGTFNETW